MIEHRSGPVCPGPLRTLPVVRADVPRGATPRDSATSPWSAHPSPRKQPQDGQEQNIQPGVLTLSEAEIRFLRVVAANPGVPSSALPKLAELSPRRAIALRKSLIDVGLLRAHAVSRAGKGRDALVLEVTEDGLRALQRAAAAP